MKKFKERNLKVIALVSAAVLVVAVTVALNTARLPLLSNASTYSAYFANAVGMQAGDEVTIAGVKVGQVTGMTLDGDRAKVTFTVSNGVRLGAEASVAAKVLTPIGEEYLDVTPAGAGQLSATVPMSRTSVPLTLVSDLSQLTRQTQQINIAQLEQAIDVAGASLQGVTPASINSALGGLARLSEILASHQAELSDLVNQADQVTGVLAAHSGQLIDLVGQADLVLQVLDQRRQAIQRLLVTTSSLGQELDGLLGGNRGQLQSLIASLQTVSGVLARDNGALSNAVPLLAAFSRYGANAAGSGPYLDSVVPTFLIPDNLVAQCSKAVPLDAVKGCRP